MSSTIGPGGLGVGGWAGEICILTGRLAAADF